MFARKVTQVGVILGALALSLSAHADTKRYLIKFKNPAAYGQVAKAAHTQAAIAPGVMAPMRLMGSSAVVGKALDHVQMLIVSSDDATAIESLREHPAIAMVEEEIIHPAPRPLATRGNSGDVVPLRKRKQQQSSDRPWGIDAVKAPAAWNSTRGGGARVLVLDTGLDTDHPAIHSNFEKGKNFTPGDDADITDTVGHGTHVSGTILAAGQNGGLVGVAPEARLLMGKVCTDEGCSSASIIEGLDWAISEKVDVVNMSLGGSFLSKAEAQALARVESAGVFVAAASGNDGTSSVGYPAAVATVTAVGAIDAKLKKADFSQWGPELDVVGPGVDVYSSVPRGTGRGATVKMNLDGKGLSVIKSSPFVGSPTAVATNMAMVFAGLGKPEDFAKIDVHGKLALISRGEISFADKVSAAIRAGAAGVIIFNNAEGLAQGTLGDGTEVSIPVVMIEKSMGEAAKSALSSGLSPQASVAVERTDYSSFQGTSMATPHVAGVAALIRAANKRLTPSQVRDLLKSTATALGPNDQNQYGSGLVNAEAAVAQAARSSVIPHQAAN